ncbi:MAG: YkgJ family cysteine cluster protein [Bacteroidota bacterium]
MNPEDAHVLNLAQQKRKENREFLKSLRKKRGKHVNALAAEIHEEVFEEIDCLTCANCCKTISPVFKARDIVRIAKHLRMKPAQLEEQYLQIDEDDDYVVKELPCPFLGADNFCSIYEVRPRACESYPHTDKEFHKKLVLTQKNTEVCPATYRIVEEMKKRISEL